MTTRLPPQGPPEPDEKLPGEGELAALYRQLPKSEPSPALDAAVLRAAAQALAPDEANPTVLGAERERGGETLPKSNISSLAASASAGGARRRPRWPIALGSAATLVLAAGLAWHMRELPSATSTPTEMDSAAPAQATAAASLPRATPPVAAMQSAEPAPSSSPMKPPEQSSPEMVVAPLRASTTSALRKAIADQAAERTSSKAKAAGESRQYAPAPMAAPAPPSVALQETSSNSVEPASKMPVTRAAPAPAAPPADETTAPQAAGVSATNAATTPTPDEAAPVAPRVRARMPVAPTPFTPAAGMDTTSYASDTPAQELDKIRQLFALGHDDEAQQRLTAFHLAHPRWDLPLDLQAKLRKP